MEEGVACGPDQMSDVRPVQPLPDLGQPVIEPLIALLVLLANGGESIPVLPAAQLQGALHALPDALEVEAGVGVPVQPPAPWGSLRWWDWVRSEQSQQNLFNKEQHVSLWVISLSYSKHVEATSVAPLMTTNPTPAKCFVPGPAINAQPVLCSPVQPLPALGQPVIDPLVGHHHHRQWQAVPRGPPSCTAPGNAACSPQCAGGSGICPMGGPGVVALGQVQKGGAGPGLGEVGGPGQGSGGPGQVGAELGEGEGAARMPTCKPYSTPGSHSTGAAGCE
ncbi:hypothetical protein HaLaN_12301 [Haematococcus lacustris]|uniref:Uncharacterized protein n=1 Tax=Haematococcus lacustris TaxID=44745 RepID=A0A699Z317_HAELA|nr:hypothetical protein HaLaN_12301 [Haematococcus lacustris]